jgi:hypothetical protein
MLGRIVNTGSNDFNSGLLRSSPAFDEEAVEEAGPVLHPPELALVIPPKLTDFIRTARLAIPARAHHRYGQGPGRHDRPPGSASRAIGPVPRLIVIPGSPGCFPGRRFRARAANGRCPSYTGYQGKGDATTWMSPSGPAAPGSPPGPKAARPARSARRSTSMPQPAVPPAQRPAERTAPPQRKIRRSGHNWQ